MSEARGPNPPEDDDPGWWPYVVDLVSSASAVALVGLLLFAVSGVWPPLVAIESESMEPNIHVGDLVFVMDEDRFPGDGAHADTGVVTARAGDASGHSEFSQSGDVIVFEPNGSSTATPVIHRAMFWVEDNETWVEDADPEHLQGADECEEVAMCPAPHEGFITMGDHNGYYDQVGPNPISRPVKPEWVVGTAEARIPYLGCIRLRSSPATRAPGQCVVFESSGAR